MALKIFGHRSPDTDATASAIVWSWYLNQQGVEAKPYVLGTPNTEALFVLKHWGFEVPEILTSVSAQDEVVIVDTNNPDELFENINECNITQIIDHHKLVGGLETAGPIDITIKPLASTASVMYLILGSEEVEDLPNEIAGLMLSCIISDTLEFRSPTTTEDDKMMAEHLAFKLGIDITEYATKMFEAKSDISAFSDEELIKMDSKKYEASGNKYRVSVLETTSPNIILDRKNSILLAMEAIKVKEELDEVLLFVVDILKEESTLFVPNDIVKQVAESKFNATVTSDLVVLPGVVSRKKQIIPVL
ncbi:manganese-dependent inorganic pyrophosphatase [Wenyingzhuangia marina]|uniref:inorganic diphosphatase n=1 Tax=Wenyingzhuangia marina TaxID=1195760 RepID=A0A1M5WES7_9FLAO|nr:manganese-dependent inorganic pyrophosphatase [Wenyingzhuangia marina]GGF81460.1 manganese-dependent inorganic pyrophosphatase [Wenyingzhuangia marina]SHH85898.1 manganese-dependent inorganic pyrophosphatase [Wenyingzhuangia marina]